MVSTWARIPRAMPDQVSKPTIIATTTMFGRSMRETTRIVKAREGTAINTSEAFRSPTQCRLNLCTAMYSPRACSCVGCANHSTPRWAR